MDKNLWLKHAPSTYTPSSAPLSFEKVIEITGSQSDAKYKLKQDHWETVLNELCDEEQIPVDAAGALLDGGGASPTLNVRTRGDEPQCE